MTTLHIVTTQTGAYAREDGSRACVAGAYFDKDMATAVSLVCGVQASVSEVCVDFVPPGYEKAIAELGLNVGRKKTRSLDSIPLASLEDILNVENAAMFERILAELPDMLRALRKQENLAWPIHWRPFGGPSTITTHCTDGKVTETVPRQPTPYIPGAGLSFAKLVHAGAAIGLTPKTIQLVAQLLFETSFISYPLTDSTHMPLSARDDVPAVIAAVTAILPDLPRGDPAAAPGEFFVSSFIEAHTAIVPTSAPNLRLATLNELHQHALAVYNLIAQHYVNAVALETA